MILIQAMLLRPSLAFACNGRAYRALSGDDPVELFNGTPVPYSLLDMRAENTRAHGLGKDQPTILIGFRFPKDPLSDEGMRTPIGHAYVSTRVRYEGRGPSDLFARVIPGSFVSQGIVLELRGASKETVDKLTSRLIAERGRMRLSWDCIHDVYRQVMVGAGLRLKGDPGTPLLPSRLFEAMVTRGFVDEKGREIEVIVHKTSPEARLQTIYQAIQTNERGQIAIKGGLLFLVAAGGGAGLAQLFAPSDDEKKKKKSGQKE